MSSRIISFNLSKRCCLVGKSSVDTRAVHWLGYGDAVSPSHQQQHQPHQCCRLSVTSSLLSDTVINDTKPTGNWQPQLKTSDNYRFLLGSIARPHARLYRPRYWHSSFVHVNLFYRIVSLSVRPWHSDIVSKRLNISSIFFHCTL